MSNRKLQAEIERVLKKVTEGVESFQDVFDKIQSTSNLNQKEKYEQDLKKEIKKLQRNRDQIKNWISSNDVKDKRPLVEARKLIEQQMEKFKACEKEMKTKAYSKEGLSQSTRMDPKEREKMECSNWLTTMVDQLGTLIDKLEAESEVLQGGSKKSRRDHHRVERLHQIERSVERHKWHINRLELILRLFENGNLTSDQVLGIQENVNYYVECSQDNVRVDNDEFYDDLNLEEEEELFNIAGDELNDHTKEKEYPQEEPEPIPAKKTQSKHTKSHTQEKKSKPPREEPIKPSKIITATTFPSKSPSSAKAIPQTNSWSNIAALKEALSASNSNVSTPTFSTAQPYSAVVGSHSSTHQPTTSSTQNNSLPPVVSSIDTKSVDEIKKPVEDPQPSTTSSSDKPEPEPVTIAEPAQPEVKPIPSIEESAENPKASITSTSSMEMSESALPSSLSDLVTTFETVKSRAAKQDPSFFQQMVETSYQHLQGVVANKGLNSQRQTVQTPPYYPQMPLSDFENPSLYERFELDTLFFIFYYQQGTYQQYLAAKELKQKSWRFHKKYLTWFQRHEDPKVITDDFEQGTYIYFDYESSWVQRKKSDFRFEYRFLEDSELV